MLPPYFPTVTAATAVALGAFQAILMTWVAQGRFRAAVGLGDGGDQALLRRIRMHANLAENAPIFLILLGLNELTGQRGVAVAVIAGAFVFFRLAHAVGLSRTGGASIPRIVGAAGTALAILSLAVLLALSLLGRGPA